MNRVAAIDIGTNTLRMVVMERVDGGRVREIDSDRAIVRLGEGMNAQRRLNPERMGLALDALRRFLGKCRAYGDIPIRAVGTSAVREAANRDEFLRRAQTELGLAIDVIDWEEEAQLTLEGVLWQLPGGSAGRILAFDIGGGSTEFILSEDRRILAKAGTLLGVVRLTERFITRHPVDAGEHGRLRAHLRAELEGVRRGFGGLRPERLLGTAGTVTTLAALAGDVYPYDAARIHGMFLRRARVEEIFAQLCAMTMEERLRLRALERGREDLIIAGAALALETMDIFALDGLTVCEYGLREGIALRRLAGLSGG